MNLGIMCYCIGIADPHEDEVQPDLATVVQKYAHLFKDYPLLFIPQ